MILTLTGKLTLDRRGPFSPRAGGETISKAISPLATSSTAEASGNTLMYKAKKPDQGHSTLLYSKSTVRYWAATLVGVNTGGPTNLPACRIIACWLKSTVKCRG